MIVKVEVTKCPECPYYRERYEFMEYTNYCGHKNAGNDMNGNWAYQHVGWDALPKDSISDRCPLSEAEKEVQ